MSNLAALADRYAEIKAQIDGLTLALNEVKAEIKATGREEIIGDKAMVKIGLSERTTLDTKLAKALLTAEQVAACSKTTLVETIYCKRIETANA
jgi:hypothetical protein